MPPRAQLHPSLSPTEASSPMSAHEIKTGNYIDVFLNEARHYLDRDDGRQRDLNKAFEFFKAAANLGSEAAWYYLALFHRAGIGMAADENEFYSCLEQARQLEQNRLRSKRETITPLTSGPLYNALGVAHMEGAGCPRNLRRASRFFKTAVLANDGQALNNLSLTVLEAVEEVRDKVQVLIDVLETVREVTPSVHRDAYDDDDEWSPSTEMSGSGRVGGVPEFEAESASSPSAGVPANAIEQLAKIRLLCNSLGEAAVRSMRSRAECGDYLRGMYNVAVAHERGLAGPVSPEDVIKTYRAVARSPGYGPAQVALAKYIFWAMMNKAEGLCEEELTSMHCDGFRYLHRAAEANHPEAQAIYAAIYREGAFNVEPSPAEAETCLRLAVDNGWRGDGTESVQSLIAAPSDYERFMQELVPEGRQVVSRRLSHRRRVMNSVSQLSRLPGALPSLTPLRGKQRKQRARAKEESGCETGQWQPGRREAEDGTWVLAPLTSTTASSSNARVPSPPQREVSPLLASALHATLSGSSSSSSNKQKSTQQRQLLHLVESATDTLSAADCPLTDLADRRLPSCDLVPVLSNGNGGRSHVSPLAVENPEGGGGGGGGAYRYSQRRLRGNLPPTDLPRLRRQSPGDARLNGRDSAPHGGSFPGNPRSYHATWEDEALDDDDADTSAASVVLQKSRSESLPGIVLLGSGDKQRGVLRLEDLRAAISSSETPAPSQALQRRLRALKLHEKALFLFETHSAFPMVLDLLTKSYCLCPLVHRREPPELHSRLSNTLQRLLEPAVEGLHSLQPVLVYLYRFLLYNKGTWASAGALLGPACSSGDFRRFSEVAPASPTLPLLVARCLETLNRHIDLMESVHPNASSSAKPLSTSSCAVWNLYLLRAMLKSRVLRYLDAADLNKALDSCPPDRAYEVYYTYLTLMRECFMPRLQPVPPGVSATPAPEPVRTIETYTRLLNEYLESAPPDDFIQFSHFSGFFTSLEPTPEDMHSVTDLIQRWSLKRDATPMPDQALLPWQVESRNHKNENSPLVSN
eukprot:Gregarina_sp_Pseudo_9__2524@NODE_279_length_3308_cov_13_839706_g261_i0_p1_GENE_NODE_279_length_3308_cov_13_839706_g261_i0NODE_279_length_3308_cov_13_839706_g261_i0_p1_ORF_typecomplete_len1049_score256_98Sel1/PF08238_12/0_2Sel1/PF08238_12/3_2e02Sel1/PF08238_12/0_35Sel1/PF08238_12/2e02Sel1/PF08238_12/72Sel1/PF08238_12/0_15_NODE_279_length_3308_cov_13_839706_g261_i01613265